MPWQLPEFQIIFGTSMAIDADYVYFYLVYAPFSPARHPKTLAKACKP